MSIGTTLSGTGHAVFLVWMVVGWGLSSDPPPFEVMDVSVVSGAEFAAMTQGVQPDLPPSEPAAIEQPVVDATPPAPVEETPPEVAEVPTPVAPPAAETPPQAPELVAPETVVTDVSPDIPDTPQIIAPAPSAELGTSQRPVPRATPRVAPEIVAPPEPDATVAPEVTQAATEQVEAPIEDVVEPAEETTAPEAAADQIVTEAEEPSFAPEISSRPQTRPQQAAAPVLETPTEDAVDPVAAALAAAGAVETPTPAPSPTPTPGLSGGQLSEGDKTGFLRQIGNCWNTGTLSTGAQNTIIDMVFDMTPDGRPVAASVRLESFSGGNAADADAALQAARRALLRCSGDTGYDLPRDQYAQWQRVILTVDPTAMRQR
jgi:hypothetical protein